MRDIKTVKLSIVANANRVLELLESDKYEAELFNKMHELRRDTIRLEGTVKGLFRQCNDCLKEFKATNSYEYKCNNCKWEDRSV